MSNTDAVRIRPARDGDRDAIWNILEPIFRAGETYAVARDIARDDALAYWLSGQVYVAGDVGGTYYLRPNGRGLSDHICNCGYAVAEAARGQGIARAMLAHSLGAAREAGFHAMQFNFVLETNARAIAIWEAAGFSDNRTHSPTLTATRSRE